VVEPIELDCETAGRLIGQAVTPEQVTGILSAIEFECRPADGNKLLVTPPSFRATKDIEIDVDLVEEVARFIGYNSIEPTLPRVSSRFFEKSPDLLIEERTLEYLCVGGEFAEVHDYIWYDDFWLERLGYDPGECITLSNPSADNCARLRGTLMPGLLRMVDRNRQHYNRFQLAEIGTVFHIGESAVEQSQHRSMGLVCVQAGKKADAAVWQRLQTALSGWARQVLEARLEYKETQPAALWEDPHRIGEIVVEGKAVGRATIVPLACKQRIDERLKAWSMAMAELNLSLVAGLVGRHEALPSVPKQPQVKLDFSVLVEASRRYRALEQELAGFGHPLLGRLSFVESFQGGSIPAGKRSLLLRAEIGRADQTLGDEEIRGFQQSFRDFLTANGMEIRG
jgi:phenylalanyl-tRNA synthetase beta chain